MTIFFAPEAERDFGIVIGFIAERDPDAATKLGERIFETIDRLAARDFDGPETVLRSGERVRSWPMPPVRVYYQRHGDNLWIVRIYHQRQSPIER